MVCSFLTAGTARIPLPLVPDSHPCHQPRRLNVELAMEAAKRRAWAEENQRRKTDYIPLAFNLLKALAEQGQLQPLVERAVEVRKAKAAQQQEGGGSGA